MTSLPTARFNPRHDFGSGKPMQQCRPGIDMSVWTRLVLGVCARASVCVAAQAYSPCYSTMRLDIAVPYLGSLDRKVQIFSGRVVPKTPNASHQTRGLEQAIASPLPMHFLQTHVVMPMCGAEKAAALAVSPPVVFCLVECGLDSGPLSIGQLVAISIYYPLRISLVAH